MQFRRGADDEGWQFEGDRRGGAAGEQREQRVSGGAAPADDVLPHAAQGRHHVRGEQGVAVADDGQIGRDLAPGLQGHAKAGDRHEVVGVDDRRGRVRQREQLVGGRGAAGPVKSATTTGPGSRPPPAGPRAEPLAGLGVHVAGRPGHVGDAGVAEFEQVRDGGARTLPVIGRHGREGTGAVRLADRDRWQAQLGQQREARLVAAQVEQEDPVHAAVLEQLSVAVRLGAALSDHLQHQGEALLGQHRLGPRR